MFQNISNFLCLVVVPTVPFWNVYGHYALSHLCEKLLLGKQFLQTRRDIFIDIYKVAVRAIGISDLVLRLIEFIRFF